MLPLAGWVAYVELLAGWRWELFREGQSSSTASGLPAEAMEVIRGNGRYPAAFQFCGWDALTPTRFFWARGVEGRVVLFALSSLFFFQRETYTITTCAQNQQGHFAKFSTACTGRKNHIQEAKNHLGMLVELLQASSVESGGKRSSLRNSRRSHAFAPARGEPGAQAVALGNLGVVCHEMGDAEQASRFLEASLKIADFLARCGQANTYGHLNSWL